MAQIQKVELFENRVATVQDVDEITALVVKSFSTEEPMTYHLGWSQDVWNVLVKAAVETSIDHGLCVVCEMKTDAKSKLVSTLVILDYQKEADFEKRLEEAASEEHMNCLAPLLGLLEELNSQYEFSGKCMHSFMGATLPHIKKRGLVTKLGLYSIIQAKKLKYEYCISECTNPATQHIALNKLVSKKVGELNWREWEMDGGKPFSKSEKGNGLVMLTLTDIDATYKKFNLANLLRVA